MVARSMRSSNAPAGKIAARSPRRAKKLSLRKNVPSSASGKPCHLLLKDNVLSDEPMVIANLAGDNTLGPGLSAHRT